MTPYIDILAKQTETEWLEALDKNIPDDTTYATNFTALENHFRNPGLTERMREAVETKMRAVLPTVQKIKQAKIETLSAAEFSDMPDAHGQPEIQQAIIDVVMYSELEALFSQTQVPELITCHEYLNQYLNKQVNSLFDTLEAQDLTAVDMPRLVTVFESGYHPSYVGFDRLFNLVWNANHVFLNADENAFKTAYAQTTGALYETIVMETLVTRLTQCLEWPDTPQKTRVAAHYFEAIKHVLEMRGEWLIMQNKILHQQLSALSLKAPADMPFSPERLQSPETNEVPQTREPDLELAPEHQQAPDTAPNPQGQIIHGMTYPEIQAKLSSEQACAQLVSTAFLHDIATAPTIKQRKHKTMLFEIVDAWLATAPQDAFMSIQFVLHALWAEKLQIPANQNTPDVTIQLNRWDKSFHLISLYKPVLKRLAKAVDETNAQGIARSLLNEKNYSALVAWLDVIPPQKLQNDTQLWDDLTCQTGNVAVARVVKDTRQKLRTAMTKTLLEHTAKHKEIPTDSWLAYKTFMSVYNPVRDRGEKKTAYQAIMQVHRDDAVYDEPTHGQKKHIEYLRDYYAAFFCQNKPNKAEAEKALRANPVTAAQCGDPPTAEALHQRFTQTFSAT